MAACPNQADHGRIASLELQVQALKAELRAAEKREAELRERVKTLSPPEPVTAYTLVRSNILILTLSFCECVAFLMLQVRDAFKSAPVSAQDHEMRMTRGFSDGDLGILLRLSTLLTSIGVCLRVLHSIVMRPSLVPEFSQKLRVAKRLISIFYFKLIYLSLFERPDPMPVIKIKAPMYV